MKKMKDIINEKLNTDNGFVLLPSILKEKVNGFEKDVSSPYMTHVIKWKKDKENWYH